MSTATQMYNHTSYFPPAHLRQEEQLALELIGGEVGSNSYMQLRRHWASRTKSERTVLQLSLLDALAALLEEDQDLRKNWSLDQIEKMHLCLFEASVKAALYERTNPNDRSEIMAWVQDADIRPFSFNVCAGLAGVDPEEMRDRIVAMVSKEYPNLVIPSYEMINSGNQLARLMELGRSLRGVAP